MRSVRNLATYPAGRSLLPDDLVEFHAARLLLVLRMCGGRRGRIIGLTKLAKLDFFVRYPGFFSRASIALGASASETNEEASSEVESAMIRHHYGPWDRRYYHVLAYLEGKQLLSVRKTGAKTYEFELSAAGVGAADALVRSPAFSDLVLHTRGVAKVLGTKSGSALKELIYRIFDEEIASRPLGEVIA
jgi:hypothetical protein